MSVSFNVVCSQIFLVYASLYSTVSPTFMILKKAGMLGKPVKQDIKHFAGARMKLVIDMQV